MQVALAAVLVHALHAALEDAEIALDGVGVGLATDVFLLLMGDGLVVGELLADAAVEPSFVRHQARLAGDVLADELLDGVALKVVHDDGAGAARLTVH